MLSNVDFAALLKSGSSNGLTSDGKSRFGLEQVKTWDKQNDAKGKKKPSQFGKTPARGGDGDEAAPKPDKYRDRAFERRKDVVTSEEAALEAVVSKLDAGMHPTYADQVFCDFNCCCFYGQATVAQKSNRKDEDN
jgi:hypothetical protein